MPKNTDTDVVDVKHVSHEQQALSVLRQRPPSASLGGGGDSDNGPCVSATLQTHTWSGSSC